MLSLKTLLRMEVVEKQELLESIWKVPDDLWEEIESIIMEIDPPKHTGRKRVNPRQMLNGIIYRMPVEPIAQGTGR